MTVTQNTEHVRFAEPGEIRTFDQVVVDWLGASGYPR